MTLTLTQNLEAPLTQPSDHSLISSTLDGNPSAFSTLITRYQRPIRALCLGILKDHHLASDAAQDAFLEAYKNLRSLKDPAAFAPWLSTIARNRALRLAQSKRPQLPLPENHPAKTADPSAQRIADRDQSLLALIANLPEQERTVILLRFVDNHSVETIASLLSKPVGTITKQLSRAYARLRTQLSQEDPS